MYDCKELFKYYSYKYTIVTLIKLIVNKTLSIKNNVISYSYFRFRNYGRIDLIRLFMDSQNIIVTILIQI